MKHEIAEILSGIRPEFDFSGQSDYLEEGMLDSFDVIILIAKLEERYKIIIDVMDIMPENFSSLEAIVELIETMRKNGSAKLS